MIKRLLKRLGFLVVVEKNNNVAKVSCRSFNSGP